MQGPKTALVNRATTYRWDGVCWVCLVDSRLDKASPEYLFVSQINTDMLVPSPNEVQPAYQVGVPVVMLELSTQHGGSQNVSGKFEWNLCLSSMPYSQCALWRY